MGPHPDVSGLVCNAGTGFDCLDPDRTVPLNDDNDARSATSNSLTEVASGQAFSKVATDESGNLAVIWYDTRRDPNNVELGRVRGQSAPMAAKPSLPTFALPTRHSTPTTASSLMRTARRSSIWGTCLGLSLAENMSYAAWTDTRNGNQDIFFAKFAIDPPPESLNDRFRARTTPPTATHHRRFIGPVVQRTLPNLAVTPGDEDWFLVEASAQGTISIDLLFDRPSRDARRRRCFGTARRRRQCAAGGGG